MTEKDIIGEMAKWLDELWIDYPPTPAEVAEAFYNAGYQKLPKDSIVLSREEYLRLSIFQFETAQQIMTETRKEVIKEFYQSFIDELMRGCGDDKEFWVVKLINEKLKQFCVDLED